MKIKELLAKYGEVEITEDKEKELKELLIIKENNNKKWKPKKGDYYFLITHNEGVKRSNWQDDVTDHYRLSLGNVLETEEEAELRLERIKVYNELKNFANENNDEIDWNDDEQSKLHIYYDYETKKLATNSNCSWKSIGQIYFSSLELITLAIEEVGEDRIKKYLFGVER